MTYKITLMVLVFGFCTVKGQEHHQNTFSITPELLLGITGKSNTDFPDRTLQKQAFINLGWHHTAHKHKWLSFLKTYKSGISLGYTDLGNSTELGKIITLQPFLEFPTFKSKRLNLHIATGGSHVSKKYDPTTNPFNQAVSTDFTWAFRLFINYTFLEYKRINWRFGGGYSHNSNGHTKLPNQGYNSFLVSLNAELKTSSPIQNKQMANIEPNRSISNFVSLRTGYGINVLSKAFDDKTAVYTISGEYGKLYNGIFKFGVGAYLRFYEAYYHYINNNESLVQSGREFQDLKSNPFANALNVGISASGEVLLHHFGINLQVGINLYKPSYKLDWRINQGWGDVPRIIPENGGFFRLGDTSAPYFKIKRSISSRLGLKYYAFQTAKNPKHNFFIGGFINANLGQADFTEVALGYVTAFKTRKRS